jgi:hypothetical protein
MGKSLHGLLNEMKSSVVSVKITGYHSTFSFFLYILTCFWWGTSSCISFRSQCDDFLRVGDTGWWREETLSGSVELDSGSQKSTEHVYCMARLQPVLQHTDRWISCMSQFPVSCGVQRKTSQQQWPVNNGHFLQQEDSRIYFGEGP